MKQTKNLTFDGHPVTLRKIDGDVLIYCKKVVGLYSQAKRFMGKESVNNNYTFGIKQSDICDIEHSVLHRGKIHVACLNGSKCEADAIMEECENMLRT